MSYFDNPKPSISSLSETHSQWLSDGLVISMSLQASEDELGYLSSLLSAAEKDRRQRFLTETLQRRYTICRGRLRCVLAKITNGQPQSMIFHYGERGKPQLRLADESSAKIMLPVGVLSLGFNVSHSGDEAMIAFQFDADLGVDLEKRIANRDSQGIARQFMSDHELEVWAQPPSMSSPDSLTQCWVLKEAVLKCLGVGIAESSQKLTLPSQVFGDESQCREITAIEMNSIRRVLEATSRVELDLPLEDCLYVRWLEAPQGFVAAVTSTRPIQGLRLISWNDWLSDVASSSEAAKS
jgi:4'-phosphopantetheinyl transferase